MIVELENRFFAQCSAFGIACHRDDAGAIRFPAVCSEVGDLTVYFDDGEITVDIENITHCHFTPHEAGPTYPENTIYDCVHSAADFVLSVLNDKRVMWRYGNGAGGTYVLGQDNYETSDFPLEGEKVELFLWSGPYYGPA